jgi:hypothetical protein
MKVRPFGRSAWGRTASFKREPRFPPNPYAPPLSSAWGDADERHHTLRRARMAFALSVCALALSLAVAVCAALSILGAHH